MKYFAYQAKNKLTSSLNVLKSKLQNLICLAKVSRGSINI